MTSPDITVIVPAFNAASTLRAQLDALTTQNLEVSFEVIVVDNNSTDSTAAIVDEVSSFDPRVRRVEARERSGPSYARNFGVRHAASDFIAFCDADDIVQEGWLTAIHLALQSSDFVAGILAVDLLNTPDVIAARGTSIPGKVGTFGGVSFAHGCNFGIHRDRYEDVGGLNEQLRAGEEIDLAIRLLAAGSPVRECPTAVVQYRYRNDGLGQWKQAFEGGRVKPFLCRALREAHLAVPSRVSGVRNWFWLARNIGSVRDPSIRLRWQWVLASRCGQIAGCWRYRTFYI